MRRSDLTPLVFTLLGISLYSVGLARSARELERRPAVLGCPEGWLEYKDLCYTATPTAMTWQDAVQFCFQRNASLVNVEIGTTNRTVAASMIAFNVYIQSDLCIWKNSSQKAYLLPKLLFPAWRALTLALHLPLQLFWTEGEEMDRMEESEGCLAVRASMGVWLIKRCDRTYPALCQKEPSLMVVAAPVSSDPTANVSVDLTSTSTMSKEPSFKLHPFVVVIVAMIPMIALIMVCAVVSNKLIMRKMSHHSDIPNAPPPEVAGFNSQDLWSATSLFYRTDSAGKTSSQSTHKLLPGGDYRPGTDFGDGLVTSSLPCTEEKKETRDATPLLRPSASPKSPAHFVSLPGSRVFGSSTSVASTSSYLMFQTTPPPPSCSD